MPLRPIAAAALIVALLLLAGCNGAKETDEIAYILVVGVDKIDGDKLKITYQIAAPQSGGGGETGGMAAKGKENGAGIISTIILPTPADSRMILNAVMSRTPNATHVRAFIFSEELARAGLSPNISHIIRNREYRESIFLIIVNGSAEEYIRKNTPKLEATISKYYEIMILTADEGTYFQRTLIHDFYTRLKNAGGSPYAVYSGINPMTGRAESAGPRVPYKKDDPRLPGGIPRSGTEDPVDFAGLAVFQGDKMVGVLNSDETLAVSVLQGKFTRGQIGIVDPLQPEKDFISLIIRMDARPRITAKLNGGRPVYDISARVEAEIINISSGINYEAAGYRELLEAEVSSILTAQIQAMIKHTQELGCDPVGFGLHLRPRFANTDELFKADMTALYQASTFNVRVNTTIRRTGLEWRTSPSRQPKGSDT